MANDVLSEILGSVLGNAGAGGAGAPGGLGGLGGLGNLGGGLGGVLGSVFGGNNDAQQGNAPSSSGIGGGALLAMLLPMAMQWVQNNGGLGAVLQKFQQKGYGQQASSWVSPDANQPVDAQAVHDVVGSEELSRMSQQLGVSKDQVAGGLAQILPHVVNHLTPGGEVTNDSNDMLSSGLASVEDFLKRQGG